MKAKLTKDGRPVRSTRPEGWLKAGFTAPVVFTAKQQACARRASGISRLCYNLAADTHRVHRVHRMPWPSAADMRKAFNEMKADEFPFANEVSKFVSQDAFASFGAATSNWRSPKHRARKPTHRRKRDADRFGAALGADVIRYGGGRNIRFGVGMVEAMLQARGGSLIVIDDSEVPDDLVRDMSEVLTCFCARLYGKRSAANRAKRALEAVGG